MSTASALTFADALDLAVERSPRKVAVVDAARRVTYVELQSLVERDKFGGALSHHSQNIGHLHSLLSILSLGRRLGARVINQDSAHGTSCRKVKLSPVLPIVRFRAK